MDTDYIKRFEQIEKSLTDIQNKLTNLIRKEDSVAIRQFYGMIQDKMGYLDDFTFNLADRSIYLNVYLIDRAYGGPEEGGWWYDCGQFIPEMSKTCYLEELKSVFDTIQKELDEENSNRRSDTGSVVSEGKYVVAVESEKGENYPQEKPSYC